MTETARKTLLVKNYLKTKGLLYCTVTGLNSLKLQIILIWKLSLQPRQLFVLVIAPIVSVRIQQHSGRY